MSKLLKHVPALELKTIESQVWPQDNTYALFNAQKIAIKPYSYIPATTGFFACLTNSDKSVDDFSAKENKFEENYNFDLNFFQGSYMRAHIPDTSFKDYHLRVKESLDYHLNFLYGAKGIHEFMLFWQLPHMNKDTYLCVLASGNDLEKTWEKELRALKGVQILSHMDLHKDMGPPDNYDDDDTPLNDIENCEGFDKNNTDHQAIYAAFKSVSVYQQNIEKSAKEEKKLLNKILKPSKKQTIVALTQKI